MKKSQYNAEQIAFTLRQAETGTPIPKVCRKIGISEQTFYRWDDLPTIVIPLFKSLPQLV